MRPREPGTKAPRERGMRGSGRLIAVIGLDGSGKTTLARELVETLREEGYRVCYLHVWPRIPRLRPSPPRGSGAPRSRPPSSLPRLPLGRAVLLLLLLWGIFCIRLPYLLRRYDVVVCDRFLHDLVTYLQLRGRNGMAATLLHLGRSLLPQAILWLRVSQEVLAARKGAEREHAPEVYARWDRLYEELVSAVPAWRRVTRPLDGALPVSELREVARAWIRKAWETGSEPS